MLFLKKITENIIMGSMAKIMQVRGKFTELRIINEPMILIPQIKSSSGP
jgi:hypothetical protein